MRSRGVRAVAIVLGGAAAVLGAALTGPAAHADDLPSLPVPPFDPPDGGSFFLPPGTGAAWTNVEDLKIPPLYDDVQYDQAYTVPDGSYEIHGVQDTFGGPFEPFFGDNSEQVTASDGVAPAVGTAWNSDGFQIPAPGYEIAIFENNSLTTSAGTVDAFTVENLGWSNNFYDGPAGIFDYWVYHVGSPSETAIPIIDIPAETSPAAAADFSTLWSDVAASF